MPTGRRRAGTSRLPRRWSGATGCSASRRAAGFPRGWRSSPVLSPWRRPRRWPGRAPSRRCCTWSTARCSARRGREPTAGPRYLDAGNRARLRRGPARTTAASGTRRRRGAGRLRAVRGRSRPPVGPAHPGGTGRGRAGWTPRTRRMQQALAWALEHDPDAALRLAVAVAEWWLLRGRSTPARSRCCSPRLATSRPVALRGASRNSGSATSGRSAEESIGHETAAIEVLSAQARRRRCLPRRSRGGREACCTSAGSPRR